MKLVTIVVAVDAALERAFGLSGDQMREAIRDEIRYENIVTVLPVTVAVRPCGERT